MEVWVAATGARAPCPVSRQRSRSVHSAYTRTVADLPASGARVTLSIVARRFRCRVGTCPRRIFSERLPGVVSAHARHTQRLAGTLPIDRTCARRAPCARPPRSSTRPPVGGRSCGWCVPARTRRPRRPACSASMNRPLARSAVWHDPGRPGAPSAGRGLPGGNRDRGCLRAREHRGPEIISAVIAAGSMRTARGKEPPRRSQSPTGSTRSGISAPRPSASCGATRSGSSESRRRAPPRYRPACFGRTAASRANGHSRRCSNGTR